MSQVLLGQLARLAKASNVRGDRFERLLEGFLHADSVELHVLFKTAHQRPILGSGVGGRMRITILTSVLSLLATNGQAATTTSSPGGADPVRDVIERARGLARARPPPALLPEPAKWNEPPGEIVSRRREQVRRQVPGDVVAAAIARDDAVYLAVVRQIVCVTDTVRVSEVDATQATSTPSSRQGACLLSTIADSIASSIHERVTVRVVEATKIDGICGATPVRGAVATMTPWYGGTASVATTDAGIAQWALTSDSLLVPMKTTDEWADVDVAVDGRRVEPILLVTPPPTAFVEPVLARADLDELHRFTERFADRENPWARVLSKMQTLDEQREADAVAAREDQRAKIIARMHDALVAGDVVTAVGLLRDARALGFQGNNDSQRIEQSARREGERRLAQALALARGGHAADADAAAAAAASFGVERTPEFNHSLGRAHFAGAIAMADADRLDEARDCAASAIVLGVDDDGRYARALAAAENRKERREVAAAQAAKAADLAQRRRCHPDEVRRDYELKCKVLNLMDRVTGSHSYDDATMSTICRCAAAQWRWERVVADGQYIELDPHAGCGVNATFAIQMMMDEQHGLARCIPQ